MKAPHWIHIRINLLGITGGYSAYKPTSGPLKSCYRHFLRNQLLVTKLLQANL